ncbi:MAG TPA: cytochrome c-type biogenesis protein CcmH [Acidimicrobiales bacterium]|nr:cytochrome c-type biogenesis protein CcmH [Acidimicrobiales bacterium]
MTILRSFGLWCVAFAAVVTFAVVLNPHGSNASARIAHLETLVRCPSCDDISVAVSNATSAIAVRHEIATKVHEGQSDNKILTSLESAYGTSILLSPATSGLGVLLWVVPLLGLLILIASAIRLTRRR